jgi:alpha-amylase
MRKRFRLLSALLVAVVGAATVPPSALAQPTQPERVVPFTWDAATVYFLVTDRFDNGDTRNDNSYGRERDRSGRVYEGYQTRQGVFRGGDFAGLTRRIEAGYFDDLGVDALWVTPPFEQIHGYVGGDGFKHYAYHGYWMLDPTEIDANYGTREEFAAFVEAARARGIRVVLDVVLNHVGYDAMYDMDTFGFGALRSDWEGYYFTPRDASIHYETYADYVQRGTAEQWSRWWGPDWVRKTGKPGYDDCQGGDQTMCLAGLPDIKTESTREVSIPPILRAKWSAEKLAQEEAELDAFYARTGLARTPRNHLVKWLTDWVREYGIDGYRIDTAKHVELDAWEVLKAEAVQALRDWKAANPAKALDDVDFWTVGEVFGHGVGRSAYFDYGFDALINFSFKGQGGAGLSDLDGIYQSMAHAFTSDTTFSMLSYLSSHDTALFDRQNLIQGGTALLLVPGSAQIFYGDETARPGDADTIWDQPTRSNMNWGGFEAGYPADVLAHWQKLGRFRQKHPAVGAGRHERIQAPGSGQPYVFRRTYEVDDGRGIVRDAVVVALGAAPGRAVAIPVAGTFAEGATVTDAYTGQTATVAGGAATFTAGSAGVVLVEGPPPVGYAPRLNISPEGVSYSPDPLQVTLEASDAEDGDALTIHYTLDGSAPTTASPVYSAPITLAAPAMVRALVVDRDGNQATAERRFFVGPASLTLHVKPPEGWSAARVHLWDTFPTEMETRWPGLAMAAEGCAGWYALTVDGVATANVVFNDGGGQQTEDLRRAGEGWYDVASGRWYDANPDCDGTVNQPPTLRFGSEPGVYSGPFDLALVAEDDSGAAPAVYYTLDGSAPTTASPVYSAPIRLEETTTVRAFALDAGGLAAAEIGGTFYVGAESALVVHVYPPPEWRAPHVHYWNATPDIGATNWPGEAMEPLGDGWWRYELGGAIRSSFVFSDAGSPQTQDLSREGAGWFVVETGEWFDERPSLTSTRGAGELPTAFAVDAVYPNPVRGAGRAATLALDLPRAGQVEVAVYDLLGRRVAALPAQRAEAGYGVRVDLPTRGLASGVYLVRAAADLPTGRSAATARFVVLD